MAIISREVRNTLSDLIREKQMTPDELQRFMIKKAFGITIPEARLPKILKKIRDKPYVEQPDVVGYAAQAYKGQEPVK